MLEKVPRWATRVVGNISFYIISFFFSEKPTGANRFQAVLTQLVPGSTAQYHTLLREGSGPCWRNHNKCRKQISKPSFTLAANLRSLVLFSGAHVEGTRRRSGQQEPDTSKPREQQRTPEHLQQPLIGPALLQTWPDLIQTRPQFSTLANRSTLKTSGEPIRSSERPICMMHVWPSDKPLYFIQELPSPDPSL